MCSIKVMFSHVSNGSYRNKRMEVVDNNSDHNEVLDTAITYKIDRTYPSNSSKDRKKAIRKRAELWNAQCDKNNYNSNSIKK